MVMEALKRPCSAKLRSRSDSSSASSSSVFTKATLVTSRSMTRRPPTRNSQVNGCYTEESDLCYDNQSRDQIIGTCNQLNSVKIKNTATDYDASNNNLFTAEAGLREYGKEGKEGTRRRAKSQRSETEINKDAFNTNGLEWSIDNAGARVVDKYRRRVSLESCPRGENCAIFEQQRISQSDARLSLVSMAPRKLPHLNVAPSRVPELPEQNAVIGKLANRTLKPL